ncbi:ABC transporter ATP-binding protein [Butyrivibrio sp. AC2005]|uniref:ABC transporter ATP-binding protein n=1 Tax=Butyrivibrio sp. AC2005 TaxID=1280672 RepID=UPI0003FAEF69|nr:ABC transporter ATP-binding protein [Butyrivibrio sp. AC2005]
MNANISNPENAIEVRNVHKFFKVYEDKGTMLRERIVNIGRNKYEKREVLKGISFDVKKGEAVALIGRNGCGKSTTLKMLTKILRPNEGTIAEQGRISSLIELGAGFHPDLTGRENIYINASIFGIKNKEVDRRLDDIIAFSELEQYIDNPVRTYSSGMYMRLAFAVAINVDADILLVDEILAVGDQAFQTKCFNKLRDLKANGMTIVLVSHSIGQVKQICDRVIWIENGLIRNEGPARKICDDYLDDMELKRLERVELEAKMRDEKEKENLENGELSQEEKDAIQEKLQNSMKCQELCSQCGPDARRSGTGEAEFTDVLMVNDKGEPCTRFSTGDKLSIRIKFKAKDTSKQLNFTFGITRSDWVYCYGNEMLECTGHTITGQESGEVVLTIEKLNLLKGAYFLDFWIQDEAGVEIDCVHNLIVMYVEGDTGKDHGIMPMEHDWEINAN